MKIAIIFDDCMRVGGVERVINSLANYFSKEFGYDVEIINYNRDTKEDNFIYDPKIKILNLWSVNNNKNFISKFMNKYRTRVKVKEQLKNGNYDIVLSMATLSNILVAQARHGLKSKIIGTEHVQYDGHKLKTKLRRRIYYKNLDYLVVLTKEDYEKYINYFKNTSIIYNPVSTNFSQKPYDAESKKIISAGRLTEGKGFDLLIESMKPVSEKYSDWKLEIFGEGDEKDKLTNLIKTYGLEKNVEIKEFTSDLEGEMSKSSFFVLASKHEGFGLVLVEAQATGLPVISFDCKTGPKEIINNNKDGVLVETENVTQLSEEIIKMIESREKRVEMSQNAVVNAERFSIQKIGQEWKILFEKALEERKTL